MSDRLLRRPEVEELTGLSRASIYRWMGSGKFPPPVRVGSIGGQVERKRHHRLDAVPAGGDE